MNDIASLIHPNDGCHPLKSIFRNLGVRQLDVARYCGVTTSSLAHYLNGYRSAPVAVETKMQAYAAQKQREAQVVAEHGE
jgi:transcriptional regulator with XRE-family HTH domain